MRTNLAGLNVIVLVASLSGCRAKSADVVCGRYIADYKVARETLLLSRDGSYEQSVEVKGSTRTAVAHGLWEYTPSSGYLGLDKHFLLVTSEFGEFDPDFEKKRSGLVSLSVARYPLGWRIGSDEGVLYKKVDNCAGK